MGGRWEEVMMISGEGVGSGMLTKVIWIMSGGGAEEAIL